MSPSPDAAVRRPGGELTDYASLLRRRWPTVLFLLTAGVAAGAALLRVTPPVYTASAQVLVTPTGPQEQTNQVTNRQREPLNLDTEAQIARSAVVARRAAHALESTPGPVEVSVPPNTSVLQISYTAADPRSAAAGASAYAQAYLDNRRETATRALDAQLKTLLTKLRQVNASLATVVAALPGLLKGTAERTLALQRQNVLNRQVYNLTVKYDALRTVAVTPGSVISDAVTPAEPSAPRPPLYLGSGLMAGLLAGVGLAWLRDRLSGSGTGSGAGFATGRSGPGGAVLGAEPAEIGSLAGREGAVLLVSVAGTSSRGMARAVRRLRRQGIPVVGAFVTPQDRTGSTDGRNGGTPGGGWPVSVSETDRRAMGGSEAAAETGRRTVPTTGRGGRAANGPATTAETGGHVVGTSAPTVPFRAFSVGERVFPP
ncbi:Wzz/FepE/Etk N-terminal domain-containing protein [Streptosporangium sp. NPDC051023]|uniref:Wzz/FepE/Etk N-terminal domain-containing protein n=1 Tax=Streptosporangium sp. NPDC051023 TaxID=3155410 RepID=UPI00344BD5DF